MTEREHGYTILELLVVLVLVGLIATAISAGLRFGTRVWERSETRISTTETYRTAQDALRSLLSGAVPRMKDGLASFHGEPALLVFDSAPPRAFGASGLTRVELALVPDGNGSALNVQVTSLIDGGKSRQARLASHLQRLRFAYLDASEKTPLWLDFWRDRPHMPEAVRLAADGTPARMAWPAFVARLPIAQDARCDFDPVSADCRNR
jgi:general secretion pathway protein J